MLIIFAGVVLVRWSESNRRASAAVPAGKEVRAIPD
jgi:hypothetical protein